MTATVGAPSRSSRSTTACASRRRSSTIAASVRPRNSPMSAPAMKPDGFAERSTRPLGRFFSRLASTASSSLSTSTESVLAFAPALSSASQAMSSSSRASRQLRQDELSPAAAGAASGPSSRLRGASVSQTLPISGFSFVLNASSGRALGGLPSPLWGGVGGGGRRCGASGVPHNDPHPPRLRCASAGGPPPKGGGLRGGRGAQKLICGGAHATPPLRHGTPPLDKPPPLRPPPH